MPFYYLDSSALLKKYRSERGTEVVAELFEGKLESDVLITSYLTVVEIASVAARLSRAGTLTQQAYRVVLANFARDAQQSMQLQSVSDAVVSDAVAAAMEYGLRAPDAIHLATALRAKAGVPEEPFCFVGSDARLQEACAASGLLVINPEETGSLGVVIGYRNR